MGVCVSLSLSVCASTDLAVGVAEAIKVGLDLLQALLVAVPRVLRPRQALLHLRPPLLLHLVRVPTVLPQAPLEQLQFGQLLGVLLLQLLFRSSKAPLPHLQERKKERTSSSSSSCGSVSFIAVTRMDVREKKQKKERKKERKSRLRFFFPQLQ